MGRTRGESSHEQFDRCRAGVQAALRVRLLEIVDEAMTRIPGVSPRRVGVAVDHGIVSLRGKVDDPGAAKALVGAVEEVEGVVHVEDHLECVADDRFPATPLNW